MDADQNESGQRKSVGQLTHGSVAVGLLRLVLPMILGLVAVMSQPIVDTYFVGMLGTKQLAAMAYIFPVAFLLSSVLIGVGVGATAVISRLIGSGELDKVQLTVAHTFLLGFVAVIVLAAILLPLQDRIFIVLGAEESLLPIISEYMTVYLAGMMFMGMPMLATSVMRASGEIVRSSFIMFIVAGANAVFDPLFIFGYGPIPAMGFQGAAVASVGANLIAGVFAIVLLRRGTSLLRFEIGSKAALLANWKKIAHVGAPSAATNSISPLSAAALVAIVSQFGQEAVAGWGVASRVEMIAIIVPLALSACIGPFVGQNMGAGHIDRMRAAMRYSYLGGAVYCVAVWIIIAVFAKELAQIFDDTPGVVSIAVLYLVAAPASFAFYTFIMITAGAFNALGNPKPNMVLYTLKLVGLYLPGAWIGATLFGFEGVVVASILSNVIPGILALLWYKRQFPKANAMSPPSAVRAHGQTATTAVPAE